MKKRKLVIDLTDASENMLFWLMSLLDTEEEEARVAAANENLWSFGCDNGESRIQHMQYRDEQLAYAKLLNKASNDVAQLIKKEMPNEKSI